MAEQKVVTAEPAVTWIPVVIAAWLVPGGGHFLKKQWGRGAILCASVTLCFLLGVMLRGMLFTPERTNDMLTTLVAYGGFVADLASGLLYIAAVAMGYEQPDIANPSRDYGAKLLVAAGLLNILAMVDAYEIAMGKKK